MASHVQLSTKNRLLAAMPRQAFDALAPHLEPCALPLRAVLAEPNTPFSYVHFIVEGVASATVTTATGRRLEIGIIGRDGISPTALVFGSDRAPHDTFMQVGGSSLRIGVAQFAQALEACEPLRTFMLRFMQVLVVQTAYTALSNGSFNIEERTARWLLMCHDRIDGDELPVTHEFLGIMLGVRRSSVTDAIHALEGLKAIKAVRGRIRVLDRERLEEVAADSYGAPEAEYERLIGPFRRSPHRSTAASDGAIQLDRGEHP